MISEFLAYRLGRASCGCRRRRPSRDYVGHPLTVREVERNRRLLLWVGIPVLVAIVVCCL